MIQLSTLKFLTGLRKNNNKIWFDEHRNQYELAKEDVISLINKIIKSVASFDAPIGNLQAKDCMFRINRDVRFSKDKSPYKTNMAGYFNKGGKKSNGAGYYLHIEPGKSFAAGGIRMPETKVLANIRQEIDYNFKDWKNIVEQSSFKKIFVNGLNTEDILTRPPKGYDENNPAIDYLKMKNFIVMKSITDASLQSEIFVNDLSKIFKSMKPMIDFLNNVAM